MREWMRHRLVLVGMAIIAMLSLSCERETWLIDDDYAVGTGEPVQIRLAYQTPASDVVVTTRSMSSMDEHDIQDLYVLVFKKPDSGEGDLANWQRVLTKGDVANSYFNTAALADGKKNYEPENGNWGSVTDEGTTNATYGTVVVGAATTQCLIYAIANVAHGEDYSRASGSLKDDLDAIDNAGELYALEASLNAQSTLSRDDRYLLMSGVFVNNSQKGNYNANYLKGTAGLVDLSTSGDVTNIDVVDITSLGVIKLRRLSSHITFEIEVSDYFSEFRPESWQVVHVPKISHLMDQGDEAVSITGASNFTNSALQTTMLHSGGKYYFDFYMFENHKQAKNTDVNWYRTNYGLDIPATKQPNSDADCAMLAKYTNVTDGEELFKYAKRELELKETSGANLGKVFWNTSSGVKTNPTEEEQLEGSKQFVYSEPNATYVVIKGRLLFNGQSVRDLTLPDNSTNRIDVEAAYAEVTYVVHLGYAREQNIANQMAGNAGSADYKLQDFNSLRNTKYTYKIQIDGLNSIYTHVVAEGDDVETSKLMPGASGHFGVASNDVYNIDCHYNAFVFALSQTQVEDFHYEIITPFSNIKSTDESINTSDPDFSWIKVRFNGVEKGGYYWINENVGVLDDGVTALDNVQTYKKAGNNTYNSHLYDLEQMKGFFDTYKNTWSALGNDASEYKVYFSVYINEYFYDNPPTSQTSAWGNNPLLYWHNFVNTPARYVSFGKAQSSRHYTKDGESSQIAPELMIVQQSIQTHYSNSSADGFGVEHSNETPNPRWYVVNAAEDGGNIATSGFSITNGWNNTWSYVEDMPWSKYVASTVNTTYHNLNMVASIGAQALKPKDASNEADGSTDNPYKASAIRLCMNRNRDENGNGVLDQEEMKWYVPTALQVNDISLCQFSYADPLLDFNSLYSKSENIINDTWGNTFVIMDEMIPLLKSGNLEGYDSKNATLYSNHTYVTSDYKKVGTQEVNNTKAYNEYSYTSRPGQVRCVRNLGIAANDQATTSPTSIVNYNTDTRTFNQGLLESRSLRSEKAVRRELEPSTHISELNRPYRYFKVAQDLVQVNKGSNGWNSDKVMLHQALTNDAINPCRTYKDTGESDDKIGSWRAPNLSELVLMMSYDDTLPVNSSSRLLPVSDKYVFVCNTVWGFTPSATVWGRAFTTKKQKNANIWSTTLTDARYGSGHWQETYAQNNAKFRCVKDVDSPTE